MISEQPYAIPQKGTAWPLLSKTMRDMKVDDLDWKHGRHGAYVWYVNDELEEVLHSAYGMFMTENGLNTKVFPSLQRMESEVVCAVLTEQACPHGAGHMTSGGTESIFLATFAAREWARATRPTVSRPNIVAPVSAHPGINKAAHYLGIDVIRVPTGADHRADPRAMAAAVNEDTIMLYVSAPAYSLGVVDPVGDIGELAQKCGLWLHVDACVGGFLAPFVRLAGHEVPLFDFSIPGVTSMSVDLHKSGYSAKGASVVLFRDADKQSYARYSFDDWTSPAYSTLTFCGTRPGGAIAAAWAALHYLGREGYVRVAQEAMEAKTRFAEGLKGIEDFRVIGRPDLWAMGFTSDTVDTALVQRFLLAEGWRIGGILSPKGLHMMFTPIHLPAVDDMLQAIRSAVQAIRNGVEPPETVPSQIRYA